MSSKIKTLIPKYAYLPIIAIFAFNCLTYFLTKLFYDPARAYDLSLTIDKKLPFVSFFILFYVLAYVQWVIGYIVIARESREYCYKVATANIIAKILCGICFVLIPTAILRPETTGDGFFGWLTSLIYAADSPAINLFPSIHCLESWAVFRCALRLKIPKLYKILMGLFSLGVFASVLLVKQHYFIDIPAGILVFEIGYLITHLTGLGEKAAKRFTKKACRN